MPSENTPVRLNGSDFWQKNWQRSSIRGSNSFRISATPKSQSILFTDKELSDLMNSLPLSRQTRPSFALGQPPPSCSSGIHVLPHIRTSRSIEREAFRREIQKMERNLEDLEDKTLNLARQRDIVIGQRNQVIKLNAGLAKYIAANTEC
jgi:hypothetical protein